MGRRGALDVKGLSTAQRRNTPQGVHPASHLRTGGWGVESTRVTCIDFPGMSNGRSPHHSRWQGAVTWQGKVRPAEAHRRVEDDTGTEETNSS
jgi:hypothetical protein